jgi:uncharacterized membrane protein (UPF0127 family)
MRDESPVERTAWLLRDGDVLAAAEVARSTSEKIRGLLGRSGYEGALILKGTRSVHTIGMRFPIDVAFLDRELAVLDVVHLPPWRTTLPRRRCRSVLEAEAGSFERWRLRTGDRLELHEIR